MWILSCDGDLFEGKRRWLRPGSTHLLGRTTGRAAGDERIQYIEHKTVSRKHLLITVDNVPAGDSAHLHRRSKITLQDASKMGTALNGEKFTQCARVLEGKEYTIKLGSYEPVFHLVWQPVTLSFAGSSKKAKEVLGSWKNKLEWADVKLTVDYVTNETTHVIEKKRNTAAGLQALAQGRWLVAEAFAEALLSATSGKEASGIGALENDFSANWPRESRYIVPAGSEPYPRSDSQLEPDPQRAEVFRDFTFVFLAEAQYEKLMPVITSGGGKAVLKDVDMNRDDPSVVVDCVNQLAGNKKGDSSLSQYTGPGGVIVVRIHDRDEPARVFMRSVDAALEQRSIEQNQFLDAILTVDASRLREPLKEAPVDNDGDDAIPSEHPNATRSSHRLIHVSPEPAVMVDASQHELGNSQNVQAEAIGAVSNPAEAVNPVSSAVEASEGISNTIKRRNRRHVTQSRFKGFDDFDPSQFSKPASQSPGHDAENEYLSQSESVQVMDVDKPTGVEQPKANTRKRPAPEEPLDENAMYESMLTGQAAMKRHKIEAARDGQNGAFSGTSAGVEDKESSKKAKVREEKQLDVMAEVQARRQREEEARQKDEELLRNALEGVEVSELKNLAKVEEMEIPVRDRRPGQRDEDGRSDRWDPAWNGRKNFKKFRPQGQRRDGPRLQRVIVPLEEVRRKGQSTSDAYWLDSSASSSVVANGGRSKGRSQTQISQRNHNEATGTDNEDDESARFRRGLRNSREQDEEDARAEQVYPEEIAGHARDETLEAAAAAVNGTPSQTFGTESQRNAAGKRPAAQSARGAPPAKKARQAQVPASSRGPLRLDDDAEDDGLKFRRKRR